MTYVIIVTQLIAQMKTQTIELGYEIIQPS